MSEAYAKVAATAHELYVNRAELGSEARKALKRGKKAARRWWTEKQGYFLAGMIGSLITLLILRALLAAPVETVERERPVVLPEPVQAEVHVTEESEPYKAEAEEMAKVLYGMARGHSRTEQESVCWCIINRAESPLYPDSIEGVCRQESQWVAYDPEAPVMADLYDVALEALECWHEGGHRTISPDYLWIDWSRESIRLKNAF